MPVTYKGQQGGMHLFDMPDGSTIPVDEATAMQIAQHTGLELGRPSYLTPQGAQPLEQGPQEQAQPQTPDMGGGPAPQRPQMPGGDQRLASSAGPLNLQALQSGVGTREGQVSGTVPMPQQQAERGKPGTIPLRRPGQGSQQQADPMAGLVQVRHAARPAGWVPGQRMAEGIDPAQQSELREQQESLHRAQFRTAQERERLQEGALRVRAEAAQSQAAQLELERRQLEAPLQQLEARIETRMREFDQLREQAREQRVDMDAARGGAAGQALGIIASALGAFGATLGGTQNFAGQMLENVIQRNVDAQLANMQQQRAELSDEERRIMHMAGSRDELRLQLRMLQRERYASELESASADEQLSFLANDVQQSLQSLRQSQLADRASLEQMVRSRETQQFDPGSPGGVSLEVDPRLRQQAEVAKLRQEMQGPTEKQVLWRGQPLGSAMSEKGAEDMRVASANYETLGTNLAALHRLAGEVNRLKDLNPADYDAALETYRNRARAAQQQVWSSMYGRTDAPSGTEGEDLRETLSTDPSILAGKTRAQLNAIQDLARERLRAKMRANGLPIPPDLESSTSR